MEFGTSPPAPAAKQKGGHNLKNSPESSTIGKLPRFRNLIQEVYQNFSPNDIAWIIDRNANCSTNSNVLQFSCLASANTLLHFQSQKKKISFKFLPWVKGSQGQ